MSSITLKYNNTIKKICFRQNISTEDFTLLISSHFDINGKITGIQDRNGDIYDIGYFISKPYEIHQGIYQLKVKENESNIFSQTYSDPQTYKFNGFQNNVNLFTSLKSQGNKQFTQQSNKQFINTSANFISDLQDFKDTIIQTNDTRLVALILVDDYNVHSVLNKLEQTILQFGEKVDFYYSLAKENNLNYIFNYINFSIPCLVIYQAEKKLMEIGIHNIDQIDRAFQRLVSKTDFQFLSQQQSQSSQQQKFFLSQNQNNNNQFIVDDDDFGFNQIQSTQKQNNNFLNNNNSNNNTQLVSQTNNQFMQSQSQQLTPYDPSKYENSILQNQVLQYLTKMHQKGLLDNPQYYYFKCQTYERCEEFVKTLFNDLSQVEYNPFKYNLISKINEMQMNQQNPQPIQFIDQDSNNQQTIKNKSQKKLLKQVKSEIESYIELTDDLCQQGIIEEGQASIIKTFILEENHEIFRVYNSYLSNVFDENVLHKKLKNLSEKLGCFLERPQSPYPRTNALKKIISQQVVQKINPSQQYVLDNLISNNDELLLSAFDVYQSDKDLDEFIDTVQRILQKQEIRDELDFLSNDDQIGTFYQINNSNSNISNNHSKQKQNQQPAQQQFTTIVNTKNVQEKSFNKNLASFFSLLEENCKKIEIEEYAMIQYMVKEKDEDFIQLIKDNNYNKKSDLFPVQVLAKQKLNERLNYQFNKEDIKQINYNKNITSTAIYSIYQKFNVDSNFNSFISDLSTAVKLDSSRNKSISSSLQLIESKPNTQVESRIDLQTNLSNQVQEQKEQNDKNEGSQGRKKLSSLQLSELPVQARIIQKETQATISPSSSKKKKGNLKVFTNSPYHKKYKQQSSSQQGSKTKLIQLMQNEETKNGNLIQNVIEVDNINNPKQMQITQDRQNNDTYRIKNQGMIKIQEEQRKRFIIKGNDLNDILEQEIQRFYNSNQDQIYLDIINEIKQIISLNQQEEENIQQLLKIHHILLHSVLARYQKNKEDIQQLKENMDLVKMIKPQEIENEKVWRFNNFNAILRDLYEEEVIISRRDYNIYIYLFLSEDVSIMAAFETYLLTQNMQDFIETLRMINQISVDKFNLDYDEMERLSDNSFNQFKIIFAYKNQFSLEEHFYIEKLIKSLDTKFQAIFEQFKVEKNVNNFVQNVKLATQQNRNSEQQDIKDLIYHLRHFEMRFYHILYPLVHINDPSLISAYEVYKLKEDKIDFQETLLCLYKKKYRDDMMQKCFQIMKENNLYKQQQIDKLKKLIKEDNPIISSAYEVFMIKQNESNLDEEEEELKETLLLCLKMN